MDTVVAFILYRYTYRVNFFLKVHYYPTSKTIISLSQKLASKSTIIIYLWPSCECEEQMLVMQERARCEIMLCNCMVTVSIKISSTNKLYRTDEEACYYESYASMDFRLDPRRVFWRTIQRIENALSRDVRFVQTYPQCTYFFLKWFRPTHQNHFTSIVFSNFNC